MYHISRNRKLDGVILKPRIPDNFFTQNGNENNTIPRVCFSETIDGALSALNSNISNDTLFVYEPVLKNSIRVLKNKEVQKYVPDAHLTKEVWILDEVELKYVKKVFVEDAKDMTFFDYENNEGRRGEFWTWIWEDNIDEIEKRLKALGYQNLVFACIELIDEKRTYFFESTVDDDLFVFVRLDREKNNLDISMKKRMDSKLVPV
jgi:hypothetical protein